MGSHIFKDYKFQEWSLRMAEVHLPHHTERPCLTIKPTLRNRASRWGLGVGGGTLEGDILSINVII